MIKLKIVTIILVSCGLLHMDYILGDESSSCQPHNICVHPGDYLRYEIIVGQTNSSESYYFGDMPDHNDIKVNETYSSTSSVENTTFILDLTTGYGHSVQENSTTIPFLMILPTPIMYDQNDSSISKESKNFNGFNRDALTATRISGSGTLVMEYDIQTGILISAHSIDPAKQSDQPTIEYSNNLVGTNIINSDSVTNIISVPAWIKNTAGWWASDTIDDTSFVKAIQYLISNKIIQIPHGQSGHISSQKIPAWIKSNAQWWSQGKISDNEFISGIQYLIGAGIVQV